MDSREKLRSELTDAIQSLQRQIDMRSIGTTGRPLVIREVRNRLTELRQALADLDAEDAKGS
jgi:hypothetical protein